MSNLELTIWEMHQALCDVPEDDHQSPDSTCHIAANAMMHSDLVRVMKVQLTDISAVADRLHSTYVEARGPRGTGEVSEVIDALDDLSIEIHTILS